MSTIITRNSATSGSSPSSLIQGELAINVKDGKLFYGSGSGNVVKEFGTTASYAIQALSSSYAITASYALTSVTPSLQQVVNTGNSLVNFGGIGTASLLSVNFVNNRSLYLNDDSYPTIRLVDNNNASNNLQIDIDTISLDGVSYNWSDIVNSTASYALNALSASYAETASYAPAYLPLTGGTIDGNVIINGTASIAYLNVSYESASVIYSSGSNQFGDASNDVQTLWGTVDIKSGPVLVTGSLNVSGGITGSLLGTASYATNALSASYAPDTTFPYTGSALITGSLGITGSLSVSGSSNFSDNISLAINKKIWASNISAYYVNIASGANTTDIAGFSGIRLFTGVGNQAALITSNNNLILQNGGTFTDNNYRLQVNSTGSNSGSLFLGGTTIATGSIARTMLISSSLSASANSDTLVGLEISPTFTNGAFTGVSNYALKLNGSINIGVTNRGIIGFSPTTSIIFGGSLELSGATDMLFKVNNNLKATLYNTGNLVLQNGGTFTDNGYRLQVNATGSNSGSLFLGGTTIATGSIARTMLISSSLSASANSDVLIGLDIAPTFTIGGFTGVNQYAIRVAGNIVPSVTNTYSLGVSANRFNNIFSAGSIYGTALRSSVISFGNESGTDYARFFSTSNLVLQNGGTFTDAGFRLDVQGTTRITSDTFLSGGSLGIGTNSLTGYNLRVQKNITGATTAYGIHQDAIIQSDVTSQAIYNQVVASTAAASFTLNNLSYYNTSQGTIGSGSSISTQTAFNANSNLIGATTNYGFRGQIPSGSNRWNLYMDGTASNYLAGSLGIGATTLTGYNLRISKTITGNTTANVLAVDGVIQSDVTSTVYSVRSNVSTAASSFVLSNLEHFNATQATIGGGSSITTQAGFVANNSLIGATNNYGFKGSIPSGTGRWNLYMDGTANNYLNGSLGIGTTIPNAKLDVNGNTIITGSLIVTGGITGSLLGTASYATQALSSSYAVTASYVQNAQTASYVLQAVSASYALTSSYLNPLNQQILLSGSLKLDPTQDPDPSGLDLDSTVLFQSSSNNALGYDLYVRQNGNLVKWKWIEGILETGLLYGGVVTYSGSNVFVSPGSGIIAEHNATTGSEVSPMIEYVTWNAITQSITNIATQQVTYLYIDNNGTLQQQSTRFTSQQYHDYIPLGAVGHFDYTQVSAFGGGVQTAYDQGSQTSNFIDAFGPLRMSGYGLTGQTGSLRLSIGSGTSFIHGGFYENDPEYPSQITTPSQVTASMAYVYRSGSGVRFDTNGGNLYTQLKPGFYDPGTGVTGSVSNNNWTIQRAYSDPKTGVLYVYFGQNIYPDFLTAVANVSTDSFTEGSTFDFTTFVGFLILKSNGTDITAADNKIVPAGLFRGSGQGSGGGVAISNLEDLTDVSITSPINGQALVYDAGIWINSYPTSASYASTASYVLQAVSASYATQALSSSYAVTASYALNASDSVWTSSGANIYYNSGNVGVGTASPSEKLSVNGNIALPKTGETFIYNDQSASDSVAIGGASYLAFSTYSSAWTERMRILSGGNVGIGTTTPAYKLSVVGKMALNDGGDSVFIGTNAGQSDDATSNLNVAIGTSALQNNLTGASNVAIGNLALNTNLGSTNTALGANALQLNTTGVSNTAVGASSQLNSGVGTFNTSVGTNTLLFCASGSSNAAFGSSALRSLTSGSTNVAIGASALFTLTSGIDNTALGTNAISNNTTGSDNTALGRSAGRYFGTGTSTNLNASASIFIGKNSRANASGETNQIVIGNEALGLGNNTIVLGNDNVVTTALKGNVGIGKTNPSTKLDVNGNTTVTGSLLVTGSVYINNALYSNQTTTLATENKVVYSVPTATYNAIFVDYVVVNGSNVRAGQIVSATDGTDKTYTETTTTDIGSTTPVTFNVSISGGNFQLEASASTSTWTVKTTTRVL
jgi:hypothetical protein